MAKLSSKSVSTHVLIGTLVVTLLVLVAGCYCLAIAPVATQPVIGTILATYVGLTIKGLLGQILQRLSQRTIEADTDTTVKIAETVHKDLMKTTEVKDEVEAMKATVQTDIVSRLDEVKAVAEKAENNTNGGFDEKVMRSVYKAMDMHVKGIPLPEPKKKEVPDATK